MSFRRPGYTSPFLARSGHEGRKSMTYIPVEAPGTLHRLLFRQMQAKRTESSAMPNTSPYSLLPKCKSQNESQQNQHAAVLRQQKCLTKSPCSFREVKVGKVKVPKQTHPNKPEALSKSHDYSKHPKMPENLLHDSKIPQTPSRTYASSSFV